MSKEDKFDLVAVQSGAHVAIHYKAFIEGPEGGGLMTPNYTDEVVYVKPPTVAEAKQFADDFRTIGLLRDNKKLSTYDVIKGIFERTEMVAEWLYNNMVREDNDKSPEHVWRNRIGYNDTVNKTRAPGSGGLNDLAVHGLAFQVLKLMGVRYKWLDDTTYDELDTDADDNLFRVATHTGKTIDQVLELKKPVYDAWVRWLDRHQILLKPTPDTGTPLTIGGDDG